MHLSLIIPTLTQPQTALRIAHRVFELLPELRVEAIVVQPADAPALNDTARVRFVRDEAKGVYMAFQSGMKLASGEYVWFLGDDDDPLEGVVAMQAALRDADSDLLVAPVLFSSGRLYRPSRTKLILHFLNWCQQGVIYRRRLFDRVRFYRRLRIQADQYVNILLRSDPSVRIRFFADPICIFGVAGISGQRRDTAYASLRLALAHRTLSTPSYWAFRLLLLTEPMVKRLVKLR